MEADLAERRREEAKERGEHLLIYKKHPVALWIVGTVTFIVGLYLFYHLEFNHLGGTLIKSFHKKFWWQYCIASLIIFFGFFMLLIAKTERVIFDKDNCLMIMEKTSCLCCVKKKSFDLKEVQNIRSFKKGHEGINFYDLHYSLNAEFNTERAPVEIWIGLSEKKIRLKLTEIRNFLNMEAKQG
jgi:hypothetical protein